MRGNTALFVDLANEFQLSNIPTVRRWIRENKINGPLTSKASLSLISKALNVPELNLLEEVKNETNSKRRTDPYPAISG